MRVMSKAIAIFTVAALVAAACFGWARWHRHPSVVVFTPEADSGQSAAAPRPSQSNGDLGCASSGSYMLFWSEYFKVVARNTDSGHAVRLEFTEEIPANFAEASVPSAPSTTPGEHEAVFNTDVSFLPLRYASRGANDLFVAGRPWVAGESSETPESDLGSGTVVERWTITAPIGAPYTVRTGSTAPIGTAAPLSTLSAHIAGGVYIPAEERGPVRVRKVMLGYFAFSIDGMDVDPEGRFLLMVSASEGRLYRLDLVAADGIPVVILDATTRPELALANGVLIRRFQDGLKKCVVSFSTGALVLDDDQNDGLFETTEVLTDAQYDAHPMYGNYSGMQELYTTYSVSGIFQ
jgi:hypothetical protein